MSKINLGKKSETLTGEVPVESPVANDPAVHYPSVYLSDRENLGEFPEPGVECTATITFRVASKTVSESAGDGKKRTSIDLDIMSIEIGETSKKGDTDVIEEELQKAEKETATPTKKEPADESYDD
jgi:hypothetical protein